MRPHLRLLLSLLLLLALSITSQLTVLQAENFNCDTQIPRDSYIPVYVRFPPNLGPWSNSAINIIESFRKMENHLLDQFNVNIRFTFGAPLTVSNGVVQCGPSGTYPGIEYLFCEKDGMTTSYLNGAATSGGYPSGTDILSGCERFAAGSRPWLRNTLNNFRVNALFTALGGGTLLTLSTDLMRRGINPFFPSCSVNALQCTPSFATSYCGDGILQYDEECDLSMLVRYGDYYFTGIPPSVAEGICKPDCTRVQGNVSTTARGGEWFNSVVWSGSAERNTLAAYTQACQNRACGFNSIEITAFTYGQWTEKLAGSLRCDGHFIWGGSWYYCVTLNTLPFNPHPIAGYTSPISTKQPALYGPLQCYGFSGCNNISPETVWRCRTSVLSTSPSSAWVACGGDQSDGTVPYWTLKQPIEATLTDETVGYLSYNQLLDVSTIPNFLCGPLYRRRQVACIRTGAGIVKDSECNGTPRPPGVIAIQPKPCITLHQVTRYGFEANATPQVPAMINFQRSDYSAAVAPALPNRPVKCSSNDDVGSPYECFQSCTSRHIRFFQCAQSPRYAYSTTSSYPPGSFTPTAVTDTALVQQYCNNIAAAQAVTNEGTPNCEFVWLCDNPDGAGSTSHILCQLHNQCTCPNPDTAILDPKCIIRPASDYAAGKQTPSTLAPPNSPCPNQPVPNGSSPLAYNPLLNGDDITVSCLQIKQDKSCYVVKLKYTQQDDEHPASSIDFPSYYAGNISYDAYCISLRFTSPAFTPICWNSALGSEVATGCTDAMFENARACKPSSERVLCTASVDTNYGPNNVNTPLSVSLLSSHAGYDDVTQSSENYCTAEGITRFLVKKSSSYCGRIQFKITAKACQKRGDGGFVDAPLHDCAQPAERAITTHSGTHCTWQCYDMAPSTTNAATSVALNAHIGECSVTNPPDSSLMRCGSLTDNDNCSFVKKVYDTRCQYLFNGQLFSSNVSADVCSSSTYPIALPQSCFKVTRQLAFDSPLSYDDYKSLQQTTQNNPQCQFRTLCSYHYVGQEPNTLDVLISPAAPISSLKWSTYACAYPFDCNQRGVCGAVTRANACGLFKSNSPVHVVGPLPNTSSFSPLDLFSQSFMTMVASPDDFGHPMSTMTSYSFGSGDENEVENEEEGYYYDGEDDQDRPYTIPSSNGPNNVFSALQTSSKDSIQAQLDIFLSAGRGSSCGLVRATTNGCSAVGAQNCFIPRCYLHNSYTSFDTSSLDDNLFTEGNCEDVKVQEHCVTGLLDDPINNICDRVQFKVYYRCFDAITGAPSSSPYDCRLEAKSESQPLGYIEKLCSIVQGCTQFEERCSWKSNNPNAPVVDLRPGLDLKPGFDPDAVDFPCQDLVGLKSDAVATQGFCSKLLFCGNAKTYSSCIFRGNDIQGRSGSDFHLDAYICRAYARRASGGGLEANFIDYSAPENSIECENYSGCSTWGCTSPGNDTTLPSLATIRSHTNISTVTNAAARGFFHDVTGVVRAENCAAALVADSYCGVGTVGRRVGCLIRKTAGYFASPSFDFDPNATSCGSPYDSQYKRVPLHHYTAFSTSGCKKVLECGAGGSEHGPNNCDYLHCPAIYTTTSSGTSFPYSYDLRCQANEDDPVQPGAMLPLVECSSTLDGTPTSVTGKSVSISTQCQYIQQYCKTNLRIPIGFGINSNVTDTMGKFVPEKRLLDDPTALKFFLDSSCSEPAALSLITLLDNVGNRITANLTLAEGDQFSLGLGYNWHSYSLIFSVYLVSTESTSQTFPYFIQQLPPSPNPHYSVTIPSWIPNGQYILVVYGNMLMINILKDQYITIKRTTPLILDPVPSPKPSSPTAISVDGIAGDCAGFLCLHGSCVLPTGMTMPEGLTPSQVGSNYQCQCETGFSGKYCAQPSRCDAEAASAANPTAGSLSCNVKYGIVGSSLDATRYNRHQDVDTCDTCLCLGLFSDGGCQKCQLQCGLGTSDTSCSRCTCPQNRSGARCECSSRRFTLFYRLPPPFIQQMFKRGDSQYDPISNDEQAQLISWKKSVAADIANDLAIPVDSFEVESYGSMSSAFGVVIKLTMCQPYKPITTTRTMEQSNSDQEAALQLLFTNFEDAYALLLTHTSKYAPLTGYSNDEENHLEYYKPSFDYQTFATRFGIGKTSKSVSLFIDGSEEFEEFEKSTSFLDTPSTTTQPTTTTTSPMYTLDVIPTVTDKYQFTQASVAASPAADAGGGFADLSTTYSPTSCDGTDSTCVSAPHQTLTPTMPAEWKKKPKPFNTDILLYIFLPILFVLLFAGAILLCCTWRYQTWCFKDFKARRERERKQRRGEIRTKRSGAAAATQNTTTLGATGSQTNSSAAPVKSTTLKSEGATATVVSPSTRAIVIDAGQGANAGLAADYHPDDFENDEEADDYFEAGAEIQLAPSSAAVGAKGKRQSIAIGGMKRVSVIGLPKGWSALNLDGKQIFVNTETMQSSSVKPSADGTLPVVEEDKGW